MLQGLHLWEKHLYVNSEAVPDSIFNFTLYFFHNAKALVDKWLGSYFYIPKLESHLEARLWNDIFVDAQELLGLPRATINCERLPITMMVPG